MKGNTIGNLPLLCAICTKAVEKQGNTAQLCPSCAQKAARQPLSKKIYLFGFAILALLAIAIARLPAYIRTSIAYSHAENAINEHKYHTAETYLLQVLTTNPNMISARANVMVAAAYNHDYPLMLQMYNDVRNKRLDDGMQQKVSAAIAFYNKEVPADSTLQYRLNAATADSISALQALFSNIDASAAGSEKLLDEYLVANRMCKLHQRAEGKKMLLHILDKDPDMYLPLRMMAVLTRLDKDLPEAVGYCNRMLAMNQEDVQALVQMAKIELKKKHDCLAAGYAGRAWALEPDNVHAMEGKALVAYFAGRQQESRQMLALIAASAQDADKMIYKRTDSVLNGTKIYR